MYSQQPAAILRIFPDDPRTTRIISSNPVIILNKTHVIRDRREDRVRHASVRFASKKLNSGTHKRRRRTARMRRGQAAAREPAAQINVAQAIVGLRGLRVAVEVSAAPPPPPQCLPVVPAGSVHAASFDRRARPPLFCRCERQLQLQLSRTPANPDRLFYSCSNRSCRSNTFVWAQQSR
jgi:hypothetical protein